MKSKELPLRKTLKNVSEGYANAKPDQESFACFKTELAKLVEAAQAKPDESEEFHKNIVSDFLKSTGYKQRFSINTKGRKDLVIHNGSDAKSCVGVIFETKSPRNKNEMLTKERLNVKALHELVYYYLQERITHKNVEVKHLIATNISEWFVFDVHEFDRIFAQNKKFVQQFSDFEAGRLADTTTDFFYKQVVAPFVDSLADEVEFTHINLADYAAKLQNAGSADEDALIELYKILSPEHLLKLAFKNDSNTLNRKFYNELLYIVGLAEVGQNGKKLIERCKKGERQSGSLLENAIDGIVAYERQDNITQYGSNTDERLFNAALELAITWVNRILFLKLLESQLLSYHQRDDSYAFLTSDKIKSYDSLNDLFFRVLACKLKERHEDVKEAFAKVPYLNSSLFAPTELENGTLRISELRDDKTIAIFSDTVLKDGSKKKSGKMPLLEYLFAFLDAYDFGSESGNKFQSQDKLINASVLGLIFEKINGYKDGSYFTPGFITMYMCREAIRKAVVQKFNDEMKWDCKEFGELYNEIMRNKCQQKANEIINSLKICDPAVGSGHFLVSALNEIIALKSELEILQDSRGKLLNVRVAVEDDELVVKYRNDDQFSYHYPNNGDCQRVQETLFHEKQTIIENCIFGVDINPNAVAICRLRLWIELLKNAYYKNAAELETLPNIDINIKCGNSLVNRFSLDTDLKNVLKGKHTVEKYRKAVDTYRNAKSRDEKQEMERLIAEIKSSFRGELSQYSSEAVALRKLKGKLIDLTKQKRMFEKSKKEHAAWKKEVLKVTAEIEKQEAANEAIKASKVYANAFEWRFEFPEVLNGNDGSFVGFDVVIGNPPYVNSRDMAKTDAEMRETIQAFYTLTKGSWDIYIAFFERGFRLLNPRGVFAFITPDKWISKPFGDALRIQTTPRICSICKAGREVFEASNVDAIITVYGSENEPHLHVYDHDGTTMYQKDFIHKDCLKSPYTYDWLFSNHRDLLLKIEKHSGKLSDLAVCENACATDDAYRLQDLIKEKSTAAKDGQHLTMINTGTISKYVSRWGLRKMVYLGSRYLRPVVSKKLFLEEFPKSYGQKSIRKKLILKGLNLLDACLDQHGSVIPGIPTLVICSDDIETLKILLGIVNSKLPFYYIKAKYPASSYNGGITFTKEMLNDLPLPEIGEKVRIRLVSLVDQILAAKMSDATADTAALESEIDRLVYELYGLAEEEIAIVEGRNA